MNPTTETTLRFAGDWPFLPVLTVALLLSAAMWFLYRREVRLREGAMSKLPAILRALAVFLVVLALSGPVLRTVTTFRQLGHLVIVMDGSASMKLTDDPPGAPKGASVPESARVSRWQRASDLLFKGTNPLLPRLAAEQDVDLAVMQGSSVRRVWWRHQGGRDTSGPVPLQLDVLPDAPLTDLDQPVRELTEPPVPGTAVILLTDGQHNAAGTPEELAASLGRAKTPIFAIGFGGEDPPPDLSLLSVRVPETVFSEEQLQGTVTIQDSMPVGVAATIQVACQGKTLWEKKFTTDGKGVHSFEFSFPVRDLPVALASEPDKSLRLLNIQVSAAGDLAQTEKTRANNAREMALHLLNKKRKVLVLDGRPRWETRYIYNHFDRDDRWQISMIYDNLTENPADGDLFKQFPGTRDELFSYDLVILGDLERKRLREDHVTWLREFVEQRGGGLILVDGRRGHLKSWADGATASLVPVKWASAPAPTAKDGLTWKLDAAGQREEALRLSDSPTANAELWPAMPKMNWSATIEPLPGAVQLATLNSAKGDGLPAIVSRPVGAGVVLYIATDELWRWRYQFGDLHHQRFWMQVAAWIAAPPFQAEDKRMSLGTDHLRHAAGERAEIRARLRDDNGAIVTDAHPRATLIHAGEEIATMELEADPTHGGVYHALTPPLRPGTYEVAIADSPTSPKSDLRLSLRVTDSGDQELAQLTLNGDLLRSMANASGGRYLREEQAAAELPNLLQSVDRRQTITRETLLWSSWWWFGAILLLLTLEWVLRKRLRLV